MGLMIPWILIYVPNISWKKIIKKSFLKLKLLPGSVLSQNVPGKTTIPKQENYK